MRIGLNATCFNARPSGANQRFRTLYGAVIRSNPAIRFLIYEPRDHPVAQWFADAPNVEARRTPIPSAGRIQRLLTGLGYWRRAIREDHLDLLECFSLPLLPASCPTLLTLHDLRLIRRGEGGAGRLMAHLVLRDALRRASHVITVSQAVRHEILAIRPETGISTVYNAIDVDGFRAAESPAINVRERWNLADAYMLTVGHIEPRKNLLLLIEAVAHLRDRGLFRPLVIAGRDGGGRQAVRARISELRLEKLIRLIEDADDGDIRLLYAECRLVVVASRYEGFGIPVVEAMAARRPLVTSDIMVFRELTGQQGCYFPVHDPILAADMIERLWNDFREQRRLVAWGDERVGTFAAHLLAAQITALYGKLARGAANPRMDAMRSRAAVKE